MSKFSEITDKAEKLVESGEIAKREVQQCSARVSAASSQLQSAQRQLDQAKEMDEDGKPKGNVSGAQSAVAVAQGKLAASRRALQDAKNKVSSINAQKKTQIRKIEAHNAVEKNNLSQLKKLQGLAFAGNTEAMYKGIVERMNSAEKAKASLNKSLGLDEDIEEESNEEGFVSSAYDNDISISSRTKVGTNSSLSPNTHNNESAGAKNDYTNDSILNYNGNSNSKHGLVSLNGDLIDEKTIIDKFNNAKAAGDEIEMNKYRTLYEINSFYNELNLTDGDEEVVQEGGLYKDLKTHEGYERHHIPSSAVQDKNKGNLPALTITEEDHKNTDSYKWKQNKKNTSFFGGSFEKYKVEASDMISNGEYAELVKAEVYNIIENNGHKYDGGLKSYFQALYTMIEAEGVPQEHSYHENKNQIQDSLAVVNDNSPMGKLTKYMSDHNYGINDYEIYSKDPEWKALHKAVFDVNNKNYYMPESYSVDDYNFLNTSKYYDAFMQFYNNNDKYSAIDRNDVTIVYIDPSNIEGIPIYSKEAKDPCHFWQMHKTDGTLDSFIHSITDYVPEVHNRLEAGQNLSDIGLDDRLSACVSLYFQDAVQVDEVEGEAFYVFRGGGRHRILAAMELGIKIPVVIKRKYVKKI